MSRHQHQQGRPYTKQARRHIVSLLRRYTLSHTQDILNAKAGTALASKRNLNVIPYALGICYPTLMRIADEAGIERRRGRPKAA